ncbi:voltage-dependent anion channel [Mariannaea sp. PMI_226]|nr:voltage-dependent anion channel [Mariannaea sp. PMI_226]
MLLSDSSHKSAFDRWLPLAHMDRLKKDDWEEGHTRAADQRLRSADALDRVLLYERLRHFTWAWFTLVMGTGGIALLLHGTPHRFRGLDVIGKIFFLLTIVLFLGLVAGMTFRFISSPPALKASLMHPTEGLFFPCSLLSVATILSNSAIYGVPACGPWLPVALRVCFWIYTAASTISAVVQFFVLFNGAHLPIHSMTPAWILPIFPAMLTGTVSAAIMPSQPPDQRLPMLVAGVTYQGLGWTVAMLIFPLYLGRLMQDGLPAPPMRPGMFMAVGPAGYTTVALIGMARAIPEDYGFFAKHPMAAEVLRIVADWAGVWIWCVGLWFFGFSLFAVLAVGIKWRLRFSMVWWAFVFPNVGFTLATASIGEEFESSGIEWLASAMTVILVVMWFVVFTAQIRAIWLKKILWPGRDEDRR